MVLETWVMTFVLLVGAGSGGGGGMGNVSILRIARLLRLTRMLRMARLLRAVPELMILVKGIAASVRTVSFTVMLELLLLYAFAICMRQLAGDAPVVGETYFFNVPAAMQSLFTYGTLLSSVEQFIGDIEENCIIVLPIVYLFILVSSLTIMNMLVVQTSLYVGLSFKSK